MAYLNVRERLIETTIAYVGPALSGKATNFAKLRADTMGGRASEVSETPMGSGFLVSFDYRPANAEKFNDCDVTVKLVTTKGDVPRAEVDRMIEGVDGLVMVLDADPRATARNQASLDELRTTLAREPSRKRSVVVQVNKNDLADAVTSDRVVGALNGCDFPHLTACAQRGEGVVETLQQAINGVLSTIKSEAASGVKGPGSESGGGAKQGTDEVASALPTAHPLLAALRQVLTETVSEQVERLGRSLETKLSEAKHERAADDAKERAELRDLVEAMSLRLVRVAEGVRELGADATSMREDLSQHISDEADKARIESTEHYTEALRLLEAAAALHVRLEETLGRLGVSIEDLSARALAQDGKADSRAQKNVSSLDALVAEIRKSKRGWFG